MLLRTVFFFLGGALDFGGRDSFVFFFLVVANVCSHLVLKGFSQSVPL